MDDDIYEDRPCPVCGERKLIIGYGLMGGGMGGYEGCDACDYWKKTQDPLTEESPRMEDGYRNWSIVRKLLIDNRVEHAALLAYSIGVSEQTFIFRARVAYRKTEIRVDGAVETAREAARAAREELKDAIVKAAAEEDEGEAIKARAEAVTKAKAAEAEQPGVAVTLDRVTPDEPKKEE